MPRQPRICIFFLGGSALDQNRRGHHIVSTATQVEPWLAQVSEMSIMADVSGQFITSGVRGVGVEEWLALVTAIAAADASYDGFIVVHQATTLPTGAYAISLMIDRLSKPIVFCASPIPDVGQTRTGLRRKDRDRSTEFGVKANFINALQVAISDLAEVVIVHGSHLYRARTFSGTLDRPRGEVIGKIDFGLRFIGSRQHRAIRALRLRRELMTDILVIDYIPGIELRWRDQLRTHTKAIFLSASDASPIPAVYVRELRKVVQPSMSVVLWPRNATQPTNVLSVDAPTRPAALFRFMWALGQFKQRGQLRSLLND